MCVVLCKGVAKHKIHWCIRAVADLLNLQIICQSDNYNNPKLILS
jgi:hypothetical protein